VRVFRVALVLSLALTRALPGNAQNLAWPNTTATRAQLALPANWPDDPGYGYVTAGTCPSGPLAGQAIMRPQGGQWNLWGFYPPDTTDPCGENEAWTLGTTLTPSERTAMQGTGMSADVAWTMTIGSPRVIIAVHDSGAEWYQPDLVNKWYLNQGELPLPQHADGSACAAYDCNGDGVFNVLDFTSGSGHDQPVIASVTDPRITGYQCQDNPTCHGDTNGNGLLDPEDLIRIFSNGQDDDGNGYVDDICGWDFFWGDNDPSDDENYGHGTEEAMDSGAETNNGIGSAGVCPQCMVIPVRVGDSFIADSSHFGEGVYFSLAHGAHVIQEALGTLNATPLMQSAIDSAYAQGAIVVASAADEDSLHHNYPGNAEHTLLVHAVTFDQDPQDSTTFIAFNNCTNGGGHLVLSTPGDMCSSEATGKSSGEAGLIYSAMLQYHPDAPPLTAPEVMQIMTNGNEDINVSGSVTNPALFPSGPGWDLYFGYGRNDAGAAVAAVMNGQIPPEIDVTSPRWFETIDPVQSPKLTITGRVAASRAPSYDYQVLVAAGVQPQPSAFQTAASVTGATTPTNGTLATFDIGKLIADAAGPSDGADPEGIPSDVNQWAATILVQAVAHYGGTIGDVPTMFRKSFFIHRDTDLFTGFPLFIGTSGDSSPHFVNLDGSDHDSLILGSDDGRVHAFQANGTELKGWPVKVQQLTDVASLPNVPAFSPTGPTAGTAQAILATIAVGSLHGDGKLQVVAATLDGQVYAWNADGSLLSGFPVRSDPSHYITGASDTTEADGTQVTYVLGKGFFASPALADLAGDGKLEIVQPGEDGWLYVWDSAGQPWPGFPVNVYDPNGGPGPNNTGHAIIHARLMTTPAIGDINGDGFPEIVIGSNENYGPTQTREYAIWHDGNNHAGGAIIAGWPVKPTSLENDFLPDIGIGEDNAAAMADLNGDGKVEIEVSPTTSPPLFYDGAGNLVGTGEEELVGSKANITDTPYFVVLNSGSFGDVDGDGKVDFVDGTIGFNFAENGINNTGRVTPSHAVMAWSAQANYGQGFTAEPLPGFPAAAADYQFFMNYAIADIDGDGKNEIISGSGVYLVTAYRADGSQPTGWPKNTGGWVDATPALGDLDGDGKLDIAVVTREGWLWVWHGGARADEKIEWEGFHHDARNTGNYETPLPKRHGPVAKSGCHCGTGGADAFLAMLACVGAASRRRRSRIR
jgi:hypothetical protein